MPGRTRATPAAIMTAWARYSPWSVVQTKAPSSVMTEAEDLPLGVVLAGGKSSRFGRDKARLSFCGQPLLRRVAERLGRVTGEVLVSGRDPADCGLGVPWLPDALPGFGPASGVLTVLAAVGRP